MKVDIFVNILSDLIYSVLVFLFFLIIYLMFNRKHLLKFFRIENTKRLRIYTSNLLITKYGSKGIDGSRYSFTGNAIPQLESESSFTLKSLFNFFLPSQIGSTDFLKKVLISDVDIEVKPSPREIDFLERNSSIITIGLPIYNLVSKFIEENFSPNAKLGYLQETNYSFENSGDTANQFKTHPEENTTSSSAYSEQIISASSIRLESNPENGQDVPAIVINGIPEFTDTSFGFIQKLIDNKRCIFYLAGLSENATAGCVYYLHRNWHLLRKKYGNETPFLILIKVSTKNNKESQVILEKQ